MVYNIIKNMGLCTILVYVWITCIKNFAKDGGEMGCRGGRYEKRCL